MQLSGHRSGWAEVIDDIDEEVLSEIFNFADVTKIASRINNLNDIRSMGTTSDSSVASENM